MKQLIEIVVALTIIGSPAILIVGLLAVAEDRHGRTRLVISGGRVRRRSRL